MPAVARIGDTCTHGAVVITGASHTYANGIPIAREGDLVNCPLPGHGVNPIVSCITTNVFIEGALEATIGSVAACGAVIITGSPNKFCAG